MELPTEVNITSHRPVIGWFIVMYKKLIRLLIAPYLRNVFEKEHQFLCDKINDIDERLNKTDERLNKTDERLNKTDERLGEVEKNVPAVLNFISSFANTTREIKRQEAKVNNELLSINDKLSNQEAHVLSINDKLSNQEAHVLSINDKLSNQEALHSKNFLDIQASLNDISKRVEFTRNETLYEIKYGAARVTGGSKKTEPKILNKEKLISMSDNLRINVGCGHVPIEGYVNIDKRELPGVDIVAEAGYLPFEEESISEFYSSHLIEHFPNEEFKRRILPYWYGLTKKEGLFRAIVPDWETMIQQYCSGNYPFDKLRLVTFGAQDYEGDFHYNMISKELLNNMLEEAGFKDVSFPVVGRLNGDCYEMEVLAVK